MRISLFFFALYASVGITLGYLPPHYRALGFSGKEIGLAVSLQPLLMIVVPPVWGYLADRTGRPVRLLAIACTGACLAFVPMLWARSVAAVVATLAVYSLFATTLASLADSVAVVEARRLGTDYARLRLWGSIGFVVATWCFGWWLDAGGVADDAPIAALAAIAGHALVAWWLRPAPGTRIGGAPVPRDAIRLLRRPDLLLFFAAAMFHWASMAPYHMLFAIHLADLGAGGRLVGVGFALAVTTEVVVMWRFRDLIRRIPLEPLLQLTFLVGIVRWALTAATGNGTVVALVQGLHGLTYGAFYVASIVWMEREIPDRLRATGRALFASLVFGIGGVFGNGVAGALHDVGGGRLAFGAAAAIDLLPPLLFAASGWCAARRRALADHASL